MAKAKETAAVTEEKSPRGRKAAATVIAAAPQVNEEVLRADLVALDQVGIARQVQSSSVEVGMMLGRMESMMFLRACGERVIAETFLQLKERKQYKHLEIKGANGEFRPAEDLKEVCEHYLGKSYSACAEIAQNYELLGSDLYDQSLKLGLQRKDYRALRALPDDDQVLVQDALASASDRDSVAELIEEIVARNAKRLADLQGQLNAAKEDHEATEQLLQKRTDKLNEADKRLNKIERGKLPVDERIAPVTEDLHEFGKLADEQMRNLGVIFAAIETISDEVLDEKTPEADQKSIVVLVQRLRDQILRVANMAGELQFQFDTRLSGVIGAAESFLVQTGDEA